MQALVATTIAGLLVAGCGTDELFITVDLGPDEDCAYVADPALALERSVFDIGWGEYRGCDGAYVAHLLTDNPNAEVVRVEAAEVLLTNVRKEKISLEYDGLKLPNPFDVVATGRLAAASDGLVAVEAIPSAYAPFLEDFDGGLIYARLKLTGTTSDGAGVQSSVFYLPIEICEGCRTLCLSDDILYETMTVPACSNVSLERGDLWCIDPDC